MVPTELLGSAMAGGFAIARTAVLAMAGVLGGRVSDLRADVNSRFGDVSEPLTGLEDRVGSVRDALVTVRASLGAIDARLSTLEQR